MVSSRFEPASPGAEPLKKTSFSLRDSWLAGLYYTFLKRLLLPLLELLAVTPDQLTILGFCLALLVPAGFYVHPWWGLLAMLLSGLADTLDGLVSRVRGNGSLFGAFLDSTLDRASDFLFLSGFWVLFWQDPRLLAATGLVFSGIFLTFLVSYVKARAEGLGVSCRVGFMGRAPRILYLLVWALLLALLPGSRWFLLWGGLGVYWLLTMIGLLLRLSHLRQQLRSRPPVFSSGDRQ